MHVASSASTASPRNSTAFAISQRDPDPRTSVLTVAGELDLSSAPSLKWALTDVLGTSCGQVVLDLSLVTFVDSTALGVLVGVQRRLNAATRLAIVCPNANVLKIFELTGLVGTFELFSTLESALAYVRGSATAAG
jgi:anti-sigma B factor antagonist